MAPALSLLLAVAGFLWLALWRERWRLAGAVPLLAAIPIALLAPRPDILVDDKGSAAAVRGADGRYQIIGGKDAKFEVENWLRADADPRKPDATDLANGVFCDPLGCTARLADGAEVAVVRKPDALDEDCRSAAVVVTRFDPPPGCTAAAIVIDHTVLARGGAEALFRLPTGPPNEPPAKPSFRIEAAYPAIRRPYMPYLKEAEGGPGKDQ
jgi:competence protein ComEC